MKGGRGDRSHRVAPTEWRRLRGEERALVTVPRAGLSAAYCLACTASAASRTLPTAASGVSVRFSTSTVAFM